MSLCVITPAHASTVLYDGVGFNDGNSGVTFGVEFTPVANIDVTMLGVYDGGADGAGLQADHAVGLWSISGQLLAQVSVDNSGTLIDGFRYTPIQSMSLLAGDSYILGAYYAQGIVGDKLVATSVNSDPLLGLADYARLVGGSGLSFPEYTHVDFRLSANMLYSSAQVAAVPLPGTLWLFGSGLIAVTLRMRRSSGS